MHLIYRKEYKQGEEVVSPGEILFILIELLSSQHNLSHAVCIFG